MLIVCGDLTARHTPYETIEFLCWLSKQKYKKIIWIGGNHDTQLVEEDDYEVFFDGKIFNLKWPNHIEYLCNSGTEFEGLKIWGTPHSLIFDGVNPRCKAFMKTEKELDVIYSNIPNGIDVLISHTPPYGILDKNIFGECCGSESLRNAMFRIKPKYIICGHIHECGGKEVDLTTTRVINCSYVNECYKPIHKSMTIMI